MIECQESTVETPSNHMNAPVPDSTVSVDRHESGRRFGLQDGIFQATTQGAGEQYLSAFALMFQATPVHLSLLSALPQLLGTWAQFLSVHIAHWFPSRKTQVLWGTVGQAAAWLPLLALPFLFPQSAPWLIVLGAALYFTALHFTTPAWAGLITDLLHADERGAYFARRSQLMALTSFVALCLGGAILSLSSLYDLLWVGFALLFLLAGIARSFSARSLTQVIDVPIRHHDAAQHGFISFLRRHTSPDFRHFLAFSGLIHMAALISGPFFVIYMLHDLQFSYWVYGAWLAAAIAGQYMTLPGWGQFSDRFGNKALLTVTGLIVSVLPMFYLVSTAWPFLLMLNFFGGVIWAGLSLGLSNYVFDVVRPADRPKAVAVSSTVNAIGWAIGTLVGSWLIAAVPNHLRVGALEIHPASNLPFIFFISGVLRLLIAVTLLGTFHEPRAVERRAPAGLIRELPLLKQLSRWVPRGPEESGR